MDVANLRSTGASVRGSRKTDICAVGYTGTACGKCAANFYAVDSTCLDCGPPGDALMELYLTMIAAAIVYFLIALCVAFADTKRLSSLCAFYIVIQQLVLVGKNALSERAETPAWLLDAFNYANVINFDISIMKPGTEHSIAQQAATATCCCHCCCWCCCCCCCWCCCLLLSSWVVLLAAHLCVPTCLCLRLAGAAVATGCAVVQFTFLQIYGITIGLVLLIGILFSIACCIRWCFLRHREKRRQRKNAASSTSVGKSTSKGVSTSKSAPAAKQGSDVDLLSPKEAFKYRLVHAWLILGAIFYLVIPANSGTSVGCMSCVCCSVSAYSSHSHYCSRYRCYCCAALFCFCYRKLRRCPCKQ